MLCFPVSAFSRLVVPVLLPAVGLLGARPFRLCACPPPVCVCVRVRVCCLLCPVFRFCMGLWPCSLFSFLPFASRATTQGPIFGQVTPYSWSTYDRYATAVVFAGGGMVAYSFGTLSISFSSVVSSLPYTSSVGLQERSSLEGESLRRIASTRRCWRCPCSGVRTDDWNWEQIRTFPSHMLAVFVKIRFSAGLWQRIVIPYGAVEFSRVVVVLVYSLPM